MGPEWATQQTKSKFNYLLIRKLPNVNNFLSNLVSKEIQPDSHLEPLSRSIALTRDEWHAKVNLDPYWVEFIHQTHACGY